MDKKILFVLHSFNINGVLKQNLSLVNFLKKTIPKSNIVVAAPDNAHGMGLYVVEGIKVLSFSNAEDLSHKLEAINFHPETIVNESLFSLNYLQPELANSVNHIIRVHEELPLETQQDNWFTYAKPAAQYFNTFSKSNFVFVCNKTKNYYEPLLDQYGVKNATINGVIDELEILKLIDQPANEEADVFTILQLGTLYKRKGGHLTLEAFAAFVKTQNCSARLIFCGARGASKAEKEYEEKIKARITELEIENQVLILNTLTNPYPLIKNCDLLTMHSSSECFPTVFLEAMFLGKPVVSSDVGGIPEQIIQGVNGYLFEEGDIEKQAHFFGEVFNSSVKWKGKSNAIKKHYFSHFDSKRSLMLFKELF